MAERIEDDIAALAALMGQADRCVVLSGVRLGATEDTEAAAAGVAWGEFASIEVLLTEPVRFWENWLPRAIEASQREPAPAHLALHRLEKAGVVKAIITQAVDHLHGKAGEGDLIEVHANVLSCRCSRCSDVYALSEVQGLIERLAKDSPKLVEDTVPKAVPVGVLQKVLHLVLWMELQMGLMMVMKMEYLLVWQRVRQMVH